MASRPRRTAVFVDFDNIATDRPAVVALHPERWLEWLRRGGFDHGRRRTIVAARVYWNAEFADYRPIFEAAGFDVVDARSPSSSRMGAKSLADVVMTIDMLDMAHSDASVDEFVLISQDMDFAPLATRLTQLGRRVSPSYAPGQGTQRIYADAFSTAFSLDDLTAAALTETAPLSRWRRGLAALTPPPRRRRAPLDALRSDSGGLLPIQAQKDTPGARLREAARKLAVALEVRQTAQLSKAEAMEVLRGLPHFTETGREAYLGLRAPCTLLERVADMDGRLRFVPGRRDCAIARARSSRR